ncbi:MAG: metallophosphoesterase [Gammaproteobacteria bacterium]|nr:metallophosphoesterase [Gammaproteobacteria bacterium]
MVHPNVDLWSGGQLIEKAQGACRVLQVSDTHLCATPSAPTAEAPVDQRWQAAQARLMDWAGSADAIVHTGDVSDDGSAAACQRVAEGLRALNLPGQILPGNHDEPAALLKTFAPGDPLSLARVLDLGAWQVIGLDSRKPGAVSGHLCEAELSALDAALADAGDAWILLAVHHPPVSVNCAWLDAIGLNNGQALLDRLEANPRIAGVISGHVHHAFETMYAGRPVLTAPAMSVQFLAGSDEFAIASGPPAFRWLDLCPDGTIQTGIEEID